MLITWRAGDFEDNLSDAFNGRGELIFNKGC